MPNPATLRKRRLRMTKVQLIDEIEKLEQSAPEIEAAETTDRRFVSQALADLARIPAENPHPVLRVMLDGTVLYANDAAISVSGLLTGRKTPKLARDLAGVCAEASHSAEVREVEFESGNRVFAFSVAPIAGETSINIYGHDITERKRAEAKIAEKEAQIQIALDYMPGGMKLIDRDLNYVLVNPQYSEICGYPAGLAEAGGSMLDELRFQAERGDFGPGDPAKAMEEVLALYRNGGAARWERTLANGRRVEVQVAPTPDGGYVIILADITARKREEQFLRTVVDTIPAALNIRDVDGRYVLINKSLADYFGIDPVDASGTRPGESGTPAPLDLREEEEFRQVVESGSAVVDVERRYETDQGDEFWLTTRQPIRDAVGKLQYVLTIAYEITELRRTEKAARESQQFLGALIDNIPAVVFIRDLEGRYIRVNRRYSEMFQVTDEWVRGKTVYEVFPKERADEFAARDRQAIQQRRVLEREERFVYQGVERRFDELNFPILDSSGEVIAVGGVNVDITEHKRVEEELVAAKDEAMSATAAKSRFLASVSHELRTPMNAIIGFTRLVMRRSKEDLEQKQYENLEKVFSSAENLLLLINEILDLSKIEAGQITIYPSEFSLDSVIDDCLRTVEPSVKGDRVRLVREVEMDLPRICTDEDKVRQILLNVLSNAAKFTDEGSIIARAYSDGEMLVIEVVDTGIGIAAEAQELIFEEFGQTEDGAARRHGGTGLGLAITRQLVRLLGGDITVESVSGAGSTFTVTILQRFSAGNA